MSESLFSTPTPRTQLERLRDGALDIYRNAETEPMPWEFRMSAMAIAAIALGFLTVADALAPKVEPLT